MALGSYFKEETSDNLQHFYYFVSCENPTTLECQAFYKKLSKTPPACTARRSRKNNYQQKGPVKTKKLTVGNFYIFHTLAVIALSFLKLLIKIKWKNIKRIPTVSFKIQLFGTELDSWWRLKSSLLRRALKIVSPCRAFCIVLFSICVINRWGDAVHLLKEVTNPFQQKKQSWTKSVPLH